MASRTRSRTVLTAYQLSSMQNLHGAESPPRTKWDKVRKLVTKMVGKGSPQAAVGAYDPWSPDAGATTTAGSVAATSEAGSRKLRRVSESLGSLGLNVSGRRRKGGVCC